MTSLHPGRFAAAALWALALAGCGGSEEVAVTGEGADAQGEIAGGTISDGMIPLEELRSSSPPVGGSNSDGGGSDGADGSASSPGDAGSSANEEAVEPPASGEEDSGFGDDAGD